MARLNVFVFVPVGEQFDYCGNVYRKRSTRTAEIVKSRTHDGQCWAIHDSYAGQWGYFPKWERVNQERAWWDAMGAYEEGI